MAFDPDKYLAATPTSEFDPDKYLAAPPPKALKKTVEAAAAPKKSSLFDKAIDYNPSVGAAEAIMTMGSGLGAKVLSDIATLGATGYEAATGGTGENLEGFKQDIQNKLTYAPRTTAGKVAIAPVEALGKGVEFLAEQPAKAVGYLTDSEAAKAGTKEAVIQGLGFLGVKGGSTAKASRSGRKAATSVLTKTAKISENELPSVIAALESAPANMTTAEVLAARNQKHLGGLEKVLENTELSQPLYAKKAARVAEEQQQLADLAGGGTSTEARTFRNQMKRNLEERLGPVRAEQLAAAGEAGETAARITPQIERAQARRVEALRNRGRMATEAAQQEQLAAGRPTQPSQQIGELPTGNYPQQPALGVPSALPSGAYPVQGMPRVAGRITSNAERIPEFAGAADELGAIAQEQGNVAKALQGELEGVAAKGRTPLTVQPLVTKLKNVIESSVNPDEVAVAKALQERLAKAETNGVVDPVKLNEIRSLGINQLIGEQIASKKVSKQGAGRFLGDLKSTLDEQINKAIGTEDWNIRYTKPYAEGMGKTRQKELLNEVRKSYGEGGSKTFRDLVGGENPKTVEKIMGSEFDIAKALPDEIETIRRIAESEKVRKLVSQQGKEGAEGARQILISESPSWSLPHLFSAKITLANELIKKGHSAVSKKITDQLTQAMTNPKYAAELLRKKKPSAVPLAAGNVLSALRGNEGEGNVP